MRQYDGEHISARVDGSRFFPRISIRNKDNICGATIAHNQNGWGAGKVWDLFIALVSKDISFIDAVSFFESHRIRMNVTG